MRLYLLFLVLAGGGLAADLSNSSLYYQVDLNHTEYDTLECTNTSMTDLCFRNCSQTQLVNFTGITPIRSPTYWGTKTEYDLKQLDIVYSIGQQFMFACQRTNLFDLISDIITDDWFNPVSNDSIMAVIEAELPWFLVIAFFTLVVIFLASFVTFSMLDGLFGWTNSTRVQKMSPSNGFFVNFYGLLIILFTILVLCGCLLCFVGNLLVTENKDQAKSQLKMDYNWSESFSDQGAVQLTEFINEFENQLLTELKVLYNISIEVAVDNVYTSTQDSVEELVGYAQALDSNLEEALGLGDFALDINATINLINSMNATVAACIEQIPLMQEAYCAAWTSYDWADDFSESSDCWLKKKRKFTYPSDTILNGTTGATYPNVTALVEGKSVKSMINSSNAITDAYNAKIYDDVLLGYARYSALKTTLLKRSADNRTGFASVVEQATIMAATQLEAFIEKQNIGFRSFTKAVQFPNYFFSDNSKVASINNLRYYLFVFVNLLSIITVVVGVFAWCVGCCNFNAEQIPTSRAGKSHIPGIVIYYSSYMALFLSLFTITCGVVYFIPTSLFAFTCDVYSEADTAMKLLDHSSSKTPNFFRWWDDQLIVDDNIIARYIHSDGSYDLTVHDFIQSCWKDQSLYQALKLEDVWALSSILGINETLRIEYYIEELQKVDFSDQLLMSETAAEYDNSLATTLGDLDFSPPSEVFSTGLNLFAGTDQDTLEEWMENLENWFDQGIKKKLDSDDYADFEEKCLDYAILGEVEDGILVVEEEEEEDAGKRRRRRETRKRRKSNRKKRSNDDDDEGYGDMGIGKLSSLFTGYMDSFSSTYNSLDSNIQNAESNALLIYSTYTYLEPLLLETEGPTIVFDTIAEYEEMMFDEMDCFLITAAKQIQYQLGQCRTIYDVLDGTMLYFCNFLVGPMTVTWMSFLMIGIGLTFYIQAARAVSVYFLRMDEIHPGDISQDDKIAAMKAAE